VGEFTGRAGWDAIEGWVARGTQGTVHWFWGIGRENPSGAPGAGSLVKKKINGRGGGRERSRRVEEGR